MVGKKRVAPVLGPITPLDGGDSDFLKVALSCCHEKAP